jgi:hypothetical protein
MKDKRAFPRLKSNWPIEYRVFKDPKAEPAVITSGILDVGSGGFCFESKASLGMKALIQFAIKPKDDPKPVIGVARTVWSQAFNGSYKNGVSFVWASWKGVAANSLIAEYIELHRGG